MSLLPQPTLYVYRGLPGSGKSTAARHQIKLLNNPEIPQQLGVRFNKDEMRAMLQDGEFFGSDDNLNAIMYSTATYYLKRRLSFISDNMNLDPKHFESYLSIAHEVQLISGIGVNISVIDFAVDINTCIQRDKFRTGLGYIGENTIRYLAGKYLIYDTETGFYPIPEGIDHRIVR